MIELALRHAFADIDLDIAFRSDARTLALFGDSGAGKTSVLNAIAGLLLPREGRIEIDGDTLLDRAAGIDVPVAARRIGYVFQDGRLFPHLDVRRNLAYGMPAHGRSVDFDAIVELLGLGGLLDRRPATLSGGERQRVAVGRALLSNPRALLLDHLGRLKRELRVSTLLVTHHSDEVAALADEVVHLDAGRVTAQMRIAAFAAARVDLCGGRRDWIG